jgi:hypothetical protein
MNVRRLVEPHLPTFFKILLGETRTGKHSYEWLGHHLGAHHPDLLVDMERFTDDEWGKLTSDDAEQHPTATLRRIFANERHPDGGFVNYIPIRKRKAFLRGFLQGEAGEAFDYERC